MHESVFVDWVAPVPTGEVNNSVPPSWLGTGYSLPFPLHYAFSICLAALTTKTISLTISVFEM